MSIVGIFGLGNGMQYFFNEKCLRYSITVLGKMNEF